MSDIRDSTSISEESALPRDDPDVHPELVFGIAGAIGVEIASICDSLANALRSVRYESYTVHLTREMTQYDVPNKPAEPTERNFYTDVLYKIKYANALCGEFRDASTLARIALRSISTRREVLTGDRQRPKLATAYIIRQLKRPAEVALLRQVYGKRFVLISAYGSGEQRQRLLDTRLRQSMLPSTPAHEIASKVIELITTDANEAGNDFGQGLRETFHLADVFIDGMSKPVMDEKLDRFIQAFFGRTDITPSKQEYGMYAAKSASLRSADLSRQVGAAIFSDDGELITQGCNEAPKAFGGTYWDSEEPDHRDIKLGYDPNDILKNEILRDLFDRLLKANLLSKSAAEIDSLDQFVKQLTRRRSPGTDEIDGPLAHASIMDLTEYGRVVHAEMCAICDAARLGRSIKGATLFCTTFPCHNCTKHILAAGIRRVVYMEPYPKSKAKELHQNEIEIEKDSTDHVSFIPFLGISPYRYRDIFQKVGKRKGEDGLAKRWFSNTERPLIESSSTYLEAEVQEYAKLLTRPSPGVVGALNALVQRVTRRGNKP